MGFEPNRIDDYTEYNFKDLLTQDYVSKSNEEILKKYKTIKN